MIATVLVVAWVAHALIDGLSWPAAFALGAIVGPTDPVAATAIARRLGVPRTLVIVLEGESLVNDATALVAYQIALAAAAGAGFSLLDAGWDFVWKAAGGIAIGLVVGWVIAEIRKRLDDPLVENTIGLLIGLRGLRARPSSSTSRPCSPRSRSAATSAGRRRGSPRPRPACRASACGSCCSSCSTRSLFVLIGLQLPVILDGARGHALDDAARLRARRSARRWSSRGWSGSRRSCS